MKNHTRGQGAPQGAAVNKSDEAKAVRIAESRRVRERGREAEVERLT